MTDASNAPLATQSWKQSSDAKSSKSLGSATPSTTATVDLSQPRDRLELARRLKLDIDEWCRVTYDDGHRKHLGASLIGRECERELWYTFRWVKHKQFDGRMLRLFQRGHLEEARFIDYLQGIGCEVEFMDTTAPMTLLWHAESESYRYVPTAKLDAEMSQEECDVTGLVVYDPPFTGMFHEEVAALRSVYPEYPQFRIEGCGGHFGGSLDAKIELPPKYGAGDALFVNEYKTWATKPFSELTRDGLQVKKHEHFAQMSTYGYKLGIKYGIYMAANKNDDDIHIEVVELDWKLGQRLEVKADRIIQSPTPPPKLSESVTFKTCAYCDMKGPCHENEPYERNCRSCARAQPVDQKQWYCHQHNATIPGDVIPVGCHNWTPAL